MCCIEEYEEMLVDSEKRLVEVYRTGKYFKFGDGKSVKVHKSENTCLCRSRKKWKLRLK